MKNVKILLKSFNFLFLVAFTGADPGFCQGESLAGPKNFILGLL